MSNSTSSTDFKVGDRVWVPIPLGRACGTVIEDRGHLGRGGRKLFYVTVPNHPYTAETYLLGEDQMEHLTKAEETELYETLDRDAIKQFLIEGGLVSILGRNSPEPVWLRRGPQGDLTYTYIEGYSATGGEIPPMGALQGDSLHGRKIFAPKRDAVNRFVTSFGLSDKDADEVIQRIGVAP